MQNTTQGTDTPDMYSFMRNIQAPLLLIEKGVIREISQQGLQVLGGENREHFIGQKMSLMSPSIQPGGERSEDIYSHAFRLAEGGHEFSENVRITRADGIDRDLILTFSPLGMGSANAVLVGIEDPAGPGKMDERYEILKQREESFFKENPALMFIVDRSYRIIDVNNAWIRISGYTRDQLLSMHLSDLKVISRSGENIDLAIRNKKAISGEMVIDNPNGRLSLVYHYTPIISQTGEVNEILAVYFDMTENRKLQRKSQLMIDKNPTLLFILDRSLNIKEANEAWEPVTGYTRKELLSMKLTDLRVYERKGGNIMDAFSKGVEVTGDLGADVPKGKIHLNYHYVPLPSEDGGIEEILAAYFDVTALQALAGRNRALIDKNPTLFFILDKELRVTEANPAWEPVTGYTHKELLSMKLTDFKVYERLGGNVMDAFSKGAEVTGELGVEVPKGKIHLKFHYVPITSEDGKINEILAAYFDITLMKSLEKKNQLIIDKNPGLIFIMDKDFRVIRANKTWENLSGYSVEQLLSMKITDFKIFTRSGEDFRESFTKGIPTSGELGVDTPKQRLYLTAHYLPLPEEDGTIHEVMAVYFDITRIRELEQKLQQSIAELAETLSYLSDNNLSVSAKTYDGDPLAMVKTDLNTSISAINQVLSAILAQSQSLERSISDVSRATNDLSGGIEQVAKMNQETSDAITDQMNQLDGVSQDITDLSASIEEITANTQDVQKLIAQIAASGAQAVSQGEDATGKMKIVEDISREATNQIVNLNNRMGEVGKIVQMIADIANQTNLLALNAAIEAARAGEHGRGFAVVAGEVKNLAGESKQATGNIEELISSLMKESEMTARSMKNAFEAISSGSESVGSALSSLNQIAGDIDVAATNLSEITRATESQAEATNRVTQNVEHIYNMVAGEEKKMTGLAAIAEETSASTEEIASASSEISGMAKQLKEQVESFTLQ
jgi:methyl-accepting chemotaxis protein